MTISVLTLCTCSELGFVTFLQCAYSNCLNSIYFYFRPTHLVNSPAAAAVVAVAGQGKQGYCEGWKKHKLEKDFAAAAAAAASAAESAVVAVSVVEEKRFVEAAAAAAVAAGRSEPGKGDSSPVDPAALGAAAGRVAAGPGAGAVGGRPAVAGTPGG